MNGPDALLAWGAALPPSGVYLFVFLWLFVESTGFPISDEPVLLLAGYLTTLRRLDITLVVAIALAGKVAASCAAFWLGRRVRLAAWARPGARPAGGVARWAYYLRPSTRAVAGAEAFFRRHGAWGVFLGRLVPVVRSFISYPAGAAHMPFPTFLAATAAGSLAWIAAWTALGALLGRSYREAAARWGTAGWLVLAAAGALLLGAWLWHRRRERRAP